MRVRLSGSWFALAGVGSALVAAGLFFSLRSLVALSLPVLCLASLPLAAETRVPRLEVRRAFRRALITEGVEAEIELEIANRSGPACRILLEEEKVIHGTPACSDATVPAGDVWRRSIRFSPRRGSYSLGRLHLEIQGTFGFRVVKRTVDLPSRLTVWPRSEPIALRGRFDDLPWQKSGTIEATLPGAGVEWYGLRNYLPGDPLRYVNWRASARSERLYTNQYAAEWSTDLFVVLDAREQASLRSRGRSLFEHSLSATASLCRELLDRGNRIALVVYGGYLDIIPLGTGRRHLDRIMNHLAAATVHDHLAFRALANLPVRLFSPGSPLLLVTPLLSEDVEAVVPLSRQGFHVMLVTPDPVAFEAEGLPADRFSETARRVARMERDVSLRTLLRNGCRVIEWTIGEPLAVAIARGAGSAR